MWEAAACRQDASLSTQLLPIFNNTIVELVQEISIKTTTTSLVSQLCWQLMSKVYKTVNLE